MGLKRNVDPLREERGAPQGPFAERHAPQGEPTASRRPIMSFMSIVAVSKKGMPYLRQVLRESPQVVSRARRIIGHPVARVTAPIVVDQTEITDGN